MRFTIAIGKNVLSTSICTALFFSVFCSAVLSAPTVVEPLPRGVAPAPGSPPPPGSGAVPAPLTPGDAGVSPPPPSGNANSPSVIRPDFPQQVLPPRRVQNPQPTQQPWPTNWQRDGQGRKKIVGDEPGPRWRQPNQLWFEHERANAPIPTVKIFCRLLVIAGAVFATVLVSIAAMGVAFGHRDSGQRVVGSAGGLILLFMAYTIYKIVVINAFRFGSDDTAEVIVRPPYERDAYQPANTPSNPPAAPAGGMPRSNLPVVPFYNARQPR